MKCKVTIEVQFNRELWTIDKLKVSIKELTFKSSRDQVVVSFKTCKLVLVDYAADTMKFDLIDFESNKFASGQLAKLKEIMEHDDTILDSITFSFGETEPDDFDGKQLPHLMPIKVILFVVNFYDDFEGSQKFSSGIYKSRRTMYYSSNKVLSKVNDELEERFNKSLKK